MNTKKILEISVQRDFDFPAERVFDAWLDPNSAKHWLFATPDGEMKRVEIDPKVGGTYVVVERRASGDAEHFGEYLRLERPNLLEFTFSVDRNAPGEDRVAVEITPLGKKCKVALRYGMDAKWADFAERTRSGWASILEGLDRTLSRS